MVHLYLLLFVLNLPVICFVITLRLRQSGRHFAVIYTLFFYASAFRHRRHYVFGLSVQSLKYLFSTCTWVRWAIWPTVTVFRPVRLSVLLDRFSGISWSLKFCMLMNPDHLQKWCNYGHGPLIFLLLASLWLNATGQIWGFWAFPGERMEGIAWNFACWWILTTFRSDAIMVMVRWFSSFWRHFDLMKQVKFVGFQGFPGECMEGMAWNFACWCIRTTFRTD